MQNEALSQGCQALSVTKNYSAGDCGGGRSGQEVGLGTSLSASFLPQPSAPTP